MWICQIYVGEEFKDARPSLKAHANADVLNIIDHVKLCINRVNKKKKQEKWMLINSFLSAVTNYFTIWANCF